MRKSTEEISVALASLVGFAIGAGDANEVLRLQALVADLYKMDAEIQEMKDLLEEALNVGTSHKHDIKMREALDQIQ